MSQPLLNTDYLPEGFSNLYFTSSRVAAIVNSLSVVSGSASAGQVAVWNGTHSLYGDANYTWDTTSKLLTVGGDVKASGNFVFSDGSGAIKYLRPASNRTATGAGISLQSNLNRTTDNDGGAYLQLYSDSGASANSGGRVDIAAYGQGTATNANAIRFLTRVAANTLAERARITSDGSFVIGASASSYKFDVRGTSYLGGEVKVPNIANGTSSRMVYVNNLGALTASDNLNFYGSTNRKINFNTGADSASSLDFEFPDVTTAATTVRFFRTTNSSGQAALQVYRGNGSASVNHQLRGNGDSWLAGVAGNVIIGATTTPSAKLEVGGTFKTTGINTLVNLSGTGTRMVVADSAGTLSTTALGTGSVTTFSFTNANGISGTVTNAASTPNLTLSLGAITPVSVAATGAVTGANLSGTNTGDQTITLTGEATGSGNGAFAVTLSNAAVTGKLLTGYASAAGTISPADSILTAIQKLNGNTAALITGVSSVFGRSGSVTAQSGDYTTAQVTESGNLYYTQARFDAALAAKTTSDVAEGANLYFTNSRAQSALAGLYEVPLTISNGLTRSGTTITANLSTGIAGGQSVIGGTASGNSLTLSSTTHATKGTLVFGTSVYDEANNRLGVGVSSGLSDRLTVAGDIALSGSTLRRIYQRAGANTSAQLDFEFPDNSTTDTAIRAFRTTNTSGVVSFQMYKGDGTATLNHFLSGNSSSYLCANNGSLGVGNSSPASKLEITTNDLRATQTNISGLLLSNNTAGVVTAGQQLQNSPALRFRFNVWGTTAAANLTGDWRNYAQANASTSLANSTLIWEYAANGGSYSTVMSLGSSGGLSVPGITVTQANGDNAITGGLFLGGGSSVGTAKLRVNQNNQGFVATSNAGLTIGGVNTGYVGYFQNASALNTTTTTVAASNSWASFIFGNTAQTVQTASSGTHPIMANAAFKGQALTANASTPASISDYATAYIEGPATGTATVTRNYALWVDSGASRFDGDVTFATSDSTNLVLGTTTGTKIGTSPSQKLGFWNAPPIVQPTTAGVSATRVGGGGTTLTDTDTYDGYTLAQVVKALRNIGLIA